MKRVALIELNKSNIDAHYRNSSIIADELGYDLLDNDFKLIDAIENKHYDILVLGYAGYYASFHLIRKLIEKNKNAKKIVLSNEYNICPTVGGFRPFVLISNYEKPSLDKSVIKHYFVNLNVLFARKPNKIGEKRFDCIYYGTFRKNRMKYFKEYLREGIYVSTSSKNVKKFKDAGVTGIFLNKLLWNKGRETLNLFKYSLYIEDEYTHKVFNNLANRWYEAGFCNCVVFFDVNCENTIRKSEISEYYDIIRNYIVKNYYELKERISECNKDFLYHLNVQKQIRKNELTLKKKVLNELKNIIEKDEF